jgi:hypothetical protein
MAIGESFIKTVAFVGTVVPERKLVGTAFFVAIESERHPGAAHLYVVTAAHVARPFGDSSFVRVRRNEGGVDDIRIEEWHFHPTEDLAVANVEADVGEHDIVVVPEEMFADAVEHQPVLGEEVYFMGLLGQVEAMGQAGVPMVRTGALGAIDQPEVPMAEPDGTRRNVRGHLIDCRSFGGFSGSPCFMKLSRLTGTTERIGLRYPETYPILLGVLGGHFDHRTTLRLPDEQTASVSASAGIGVVYPVEVLRETLALDELAEQRTQAGPPSDPGV